MVAVEDQPQQEQLGLLTLVAVEEVEDIIIPEAYHTQVPTEALE